MMRKRLPVLILASVILFAALTGCSGKKGGGSSQANTGAGTDGKYKVGMIQLGGNETAGGRARLLSQNAIAEAAGFELLLVQLGGYDDESFMTAYESMINQGVNMVGVFTLSETVLPLLKDLFEQHNVKFFLMNRKVSNKKMEDLLFSSPMYIGNDHADETENAYNMVKQLKETYGIKNLAAIGLTKGDINGDYRDAGIAKACADLGINLLTTTRGIGTTEDITKAVDGLIASYPEMDSIFIVGGLITSGALAGANQAIVNHRMQNKVVIAMVDISTGMLEYMDKGPLKLVAGGNLLCDSIFGLVAMANEIHGTPLAKGPIIKVPMFWITSGEDAGNYDKYVEGTVTPFSKEDYEKTMFKWLNSDVTLESVQRISNDFSIASVLARNKDKF
jgi:ABC-type sugar transport system substrate-binding protein